MVPVEKSMRTLPALESVIHKTKFAEALADSSTARWFVFKPKIPLWVNLGVLKIGQC
jgi:hypothetical protein